MPTVDEVLRQSGFSDDEISRLDHRAITGFGNILTESLNAQERAETERLANAQFYEDKIVPALAGWELEKQQLEGEKARMQAEAKFYREGARAAGISIADPDSGQYIAGTGTGSPAFSGNMNELVSRAGEALGTLADLQWKYESLFGSKLPISPSVLIQEADRAHLDPVTYAAKKFNFAQREREIAEAKQKMHDDEIRRQATAEADRKWSEKVGNNPDVRKGEASRFADLQRAVRQDARPDPLKLDATQRRQMTRNQIRSEISDSETS